MGHVRCFGFASCQQESTMKILMALSMSALAFSLMVGLTALTYAEEPQARVLETQVISTYSEAYHGWPTLIQRHDGELVVVYSGGREKHVCPFGRVEMIQSSDQGKSWSFPRVLMDGPIDDRDAGLCETSQGSLLVSTFTSLAYEDGLATLQGKERERWLAVHHRLSAEQRQRELGVWMMRSSDGGVTWSARYPCMVSSPHGPVALRDGRLLYAGVSLWQQERRVGIVQSLDDGLTWKWMVDIPSGEGHALEQYHELHLVECQSGRLLVHIRNHNPMHQFGNLANRIG